MRSSRDLSRQSLERARENEMERDVGGTDGEEGGGQVFIVVEEKRRGLATRAFPDQASAKPGGSNRTTEITKLNIIITFY
jgi:hypothetical protein